MKRWHLLCTLLQWLIFIIHFNNKLNPHRDASLFLIGYRGFLGESDEFIDFARAEAFFSLTSLIRLLRKSCSQPSQFGDSEYTNFHVFRLIV